MSAVNRQRHHGLPRTCNQLRHPACSFKEMQRAYVHMCICAYVQMQRGGGAAIRHFNCGLVHGAAPLYSRVPCCCPRGVQLAAERAAAGSACSYTGTKQPTRSYKTASALDLHRDMLYKYSTYTYILFVSFYIRISTAGIPRQRWARTCERRKNTV
jgi:hypothetical protein